MAIPAKSQEEEENSAIDMPGNSFVVIVRWLSLLGLDYWRTNINLAPGMKFDYDCIRNRINIPESSFGPFDSFPSFHLYSILQ
jgi:hypothetical protein